MSGTQFFSAKIERKVIRFENLAFKHWMLTERILSPLLFEKLTPSWFSSMYEVEILLLE
jgi:hypothetical protein